MPGKVGNLCKTVEEMSMEWRIPNFFTLSHEVDGRYCSPPFRLMGESWCLGMYPNGRSRHINKGLISVYLYIKRASKPMTVAFSIGFKTADGKKYKNSSFTYTFDAKSECCGFSSFMRRSKLIENKTTLVPSDVLTVICSIKRHAPGRVSRTEKLSRDLGYLLEDETNSDVTVRVGATEFRLHRNILGARSPVFAAMFRHQTTEKVTGLVTIEDCRADVFHSFTEYLYTGKMEELSIGNVSDLFKVADKYQVTSLVDDCDLYMQNMLTVDTFCEVVEVASDSGEESLMKKAIEESLMKKAIDLLSEKMGEIIETEQWENFMIANPIRANDLLKKALNKAKR